MCFVCMCICSVGQQRLSLAQVAGWLADWLASWLAGWFPCHSLRPVSLYVASIAAVPEVPWVHNLSLSRIMCDSEIYFWPVRERNILVGFLYTTTFLHRLQNETRSPVTIYLQHSSPIYSYSTFFPRYNSTAKNFICCCSVQTDIPTTRNGFFYTKNWSISGLNQNMLLLLPSPLRMTILRFCNRIVINIQWIRSKTTRIPSICANFITPRPDYKKDFSDHQPAHMSNFMLSIIWSLSGA